MANEKPIVEFKDGKKIVTHPSGEVKEYTKEQLVKTKEIFTSRKQKLDEHIAAIDDDLKQIPDKPKEEIISAE